MLESLARDVKKQGERHGKLKQAMSTMASEMQDIVDGQSSNDANSEADRKSLHRLVRDFGDEQEKFEVLQERGASQGDTIRSYSVKIQLLETGLATAQSDLEAQQELIDISQAKTPRNSQMLRSKGGNEETVVLPSGTSVSVKVALLGAVLTAITAVAIAVMVMR